MPEPRISRRCPSCGASSRESAAFCPQCGKELRKKNSHSEKTSTSTVTAPLNDVSQAKDTSKVELPTVKIAEKPHEPDKELKDTLKIEDPAVKIAEKPHKPDKELKDTLKIEDPAVKIAEKPRKPDKELTDMLKIEVPAVQIADKPNEAEKEAKEIASRAPKMPDNVAVGKVRDRIQRATTLARDVEGDVIHRVQKVREISSVVLDEAAYDPSLRFVLVACVLFLLFLLIMLLNKLIG